MDKPSNEDRNRESDTKILFKRSINTNFTNSTCSSEASQLVSKNSYLRIKKNSQNNNYYKDGHKLKRDLSVETNVCILRRYCKIKRHKMSNHGSSVVSKYSTVVDTEFEPIEEYPDTSACGDNEIMEVRSNRRTDIEALMVNNLKTVIAQWIQKNMLHNKDQQNKIDTVLNYLIYKLDNNYVLKTSSDSTYVIHGAKKKQIDKNKNIATTLITSEYCKSCRNKIQTSGTISCKDSSTLTIPCNYKDIRIISTLSVPRSVHKPKLDHKKTRTSLHERTKINKKNILLSINKTKISQNSTSHDIIAVLTKPRTKKCQYHNTNIKRRRHLLLLPVVHNSNSSITSATKQDKVKTKFVINENKLYDVSSLLKSLYATSIDKDVQFNTNRDNSTMTENTPNEIFQDHIAAAPNNICAEEKTLDVNHNKQVVIDVKKYKDGQSSNHLANTSTKAKASRCRKPTGKRKRNKHIGHTLTRYAWHRNTYNEKKICIHKKIKNPVERMEFVKYCRSIFQYITESDSNKNVRFDVRINIIPMTECRTKDTYTDMSKKALNTYDINSPTILYVDNNIKSTPVEAQSHMQASTVLDINCERNPINSSSKFNNAEIIPLLQDVASQDKHVFKDNSGQKSEAKSDLLTRDTLSQLNILQEITELRAVIKDLAKTAEKFVNEQKTVPKTNAETHVSLNMNENLTVSSRCETPINMVNPSNNTQMLVDTAKLQSDMVKEEKSKETFDYYNRLTKKSTSYRIIDSESLLKVTDMTSKANEENKHSRKFIDEALTCSLPKSRSLFEIASDRNKKCIAIFYDNHLNTKVNSKIQDSRSTAPSPCKSSETFTRSKRWRFWSKLENKHDSKCPFDSTCESQRVIKLSATSPDGRYNSTLSYRSMNSIIDEEDEIVSKQQSKGISFGQGCVYCMLLWGVVIIILILLYSHVLKDYLSGSDQNKTELLETELLRRKFNLSLSDLGF